jgi:phage I-like protein
MLHSKAASEADLELRFRALEQDPALDGSAQFAAASELDAELDALKQKLRVRV